MGIQVIREFWEFSCETSLLKAKITSTGLGIIVKTYFHKERLCISVYQCKRFVPKHNKPPFTVSAFFHTVFDIIGEFVSHSFCTLGIFVLYFEGLKLRREESPLEHVNRGPNPAIVEKIIKKL